MRRLKQDESGATAVIVAILLTVLVGITAFVVDIGDVLWERRMLQNSADAAALAVAIDCAQGDCLDYQATASAYAEDNNFRGAHVVSVVGSDGVSPPTPEGLEVTVTTSTGDSSGEGRLRQWFAGVLGQDEGLATGAAATAVWGAVSMADSALPLTISMCDWEDALGFPFDPDNLSPLTGLPTVAELPAGDYFGKTKGVTIQFHNTGDPDDCEAKPGHDADGDGKLPAGWGWLGEDEVVDCAIKNVSAEEDGSFWAYKDPGNNPNKACLDAALGKAVVVPVFIDFLKGNPRDQYRLYAPAAFYLTGYRFPGMVAPSTALRPCNPPDTCISGHFVLKTEAGKVPTGDIDLGVKSVALRQ
jgi:Flp pilus assembly protein TadG